MRRAQAELDRVVGSSRSPHWDDADRLPERLFPQSEHHRPFPNDRGYMTFGWGRRVCSGQALAEQGVWITVARLLWAGSRSGNLPKSP